MLNIVDSHFKTIHKDFSSAFYNDSMSDSFNMSSYLHQESHFNHTELIGYIFTVDIKWISITKPPPLPDFTSKVQKSIYHLIKSY